MEKVGKTTLRYDVNKISYDYTVKVTSRFKGLDLIDRVPDELWTEVRVIVQKSGIKTNPKKKKGKKAKWLSEEALQIAVKRRESKSKGKKQRYTHTHTHTHMLMLLMFCSQIILMLKHVLRATVFVCH